MKNILIINSHQKYEGFADGNLTKDYINVADSFFTTNDFSVQHTLIEDGYDKDKELEKLLWADAILFQTPIYWMSVPWIGKKYFDEVFTPSQGTLYVNDGRSRDDASKK